MARNGRMPACMRRSKARPRTRRMRALPHQATGALRWSRTTRSPAAAGASGRWRLIRCPQPTAAACRLRASAARACTPRRPTRSMQPRTRIALLRGAARQTEWGGRGRWQCRRGGCRHCNAAGGAQGLVDVLLSSSMLLQRCAGNVAPARRCGTSLLLHFCRLAAW